MQKEEKQTVKKPSLNKMKTKQQVTLTHVPLALPPLGQAPLLPDALHATGNTGRTGTG